MIFRNWVLQNFPFLEDDFDALTDYELFCKMMEYVKQFAKDNEEFKKQLEELETYVYNLDIQDAVNNKLDEMAESGELTEIISQYLQFSTTFTYNNVAEMKLAENLVNGSFTRTSGYYSYNDGGGAYYKVRDVINTDVIDDVLIVGLYNENLVAELIINDKMNVKSFGVKGDGETDDTVNFQKAIDNSNYLYVNSGTYMINSVSHLNLKSNFKLILDENAIIESIANNETNYAILYLNSISNVEISGGTIKGDRATHTGLSGEWGHCIHSVNSNDIVINNIKLIDAWGDGLYVNGGANFITENVIVDNCRRNGYSIISINGFKSINDSIKNINGTAPEAGVDIEPNLATDLIDNIIFDNLTCYNTTGDGIDVSLQNVTTNLINITFNNPHVKNSNIGIATGFPLNSVGNINIVNPHIENTNSYGIKCSCPYSLNGVKTNIINPYITNFNINNSSNISGIMLTSNNTNRWGNVIIKNPYIITSSEVLSSSLGIILGGYDGGHPVNVILDTPLNKQLPIFNSYGENIKIIDPLECYTVNTFTTNGLVQNNNDVNTVYTNADREEGGTCIIRNYTSIGLDTKFIKLKDNRFSVKIPGTQYCYSVSQSAGPTITLVNIGDSVTLRKINDTTWIIVNMVGTPTIS